MAMLEVRGLARCYGDGMEVLSDIDLDLDAGQVMVLVGPNGGGKSTLLRCLTGVDEPTSGTVLLDQEPLDERTPETRRAIAAVLDDIDFFPDLSVVEHLDLMARAHGVEDPESVVDEALAELGLWELSGRLPGSLSSGQRRRLALAGAFVRPRRLLVLDEPEQRLDRSGVEWLARRLVREKKDGLAVLVATHSPSLQEAIASGKRDQVVEIGGPR
ncbi:MAG: heme ABC exporter ATP-binding protein CcmA [Nocardioides sp.]|nr:heme ABC exporter ATP-binding protein CcmA [Nocardioides sp.]